MPTNSLKVTRAEFDAVLEIGGVGIYEIVQFSMQYAINDIPRAQVVLAVGRNVTNGLKQATIHTTADKLDNNKIAKIRVSASGDDIQGDEVVFEGRLTGFAYSRTQGRTTATVTLIHWLADLAYSSALAEELHPSNPFMFHRQAVIKIQDARAGSSSDKPHSISATTARPFVNAARIREDFWGAAIKPLFCAVANFPFIAISGDECLGTPAGSNSQALPALSRIEGDSGDDCAKPLEYALPLSFDPEGVPATVANSIAKSIGNEMIASWAGTTFWNKLLVFASQYFFAVIPQAESAMVVPFTPALRQSYKTINLEDYDIISTNMLIPRPIRSVVLYGGKDFRTSPAGAGQTSGGGDPTIELGGCYTPSGVEHGIVLTRQSPTWLANIAAHKTTTKKSTRIEVGEPTATSTSPAAADNTPSPNTGEEGDGGWNDAVEVGARLHARYAKEMYYREALRGRTGQLSGKLRFDISPGATLRIEGAEGQFLVEGDKLGESIFGVVDRVVISMNAESSQAGTGFLLTHIRSEKENAEDAFSTEEHVLYKQTWLGAPLVPGFASGLTGVI